MDIGRVQPFEGLMIGIIIIVFLWAWRMYIHPLKRINLELKRVKGYIENNDIRFSHNYVEFLENIDMSPNIKPYFEAYGNALHIFSAQDELDERLPHIEDYLNYDSIIEEHGNRPIMAFMPGALTALGILGTFLGLWIGLGGIDITSVQNTQASVINLITGISGAFTTSLFGISLSILLSIIDRKALNELNMNVRGTIGQIQKKNYMVKNSDVFNSLLLVQEEQRDLFRTFAEDISTKLADKITTEFNDRIDPLFQEMKKSNENLISSVSDNQVKGIESIIEQFMDGVDALFGDQFENMADTIEELLKWQMESKNMMGELTENFSVISQQLIDQSEKMKESSTLLAQNIEDMRNVSEKVGELVTIMSETAKSYETTSENNLSAIHDLELIVTQTSDRIKEMEETMTHFSDGLKGILDGINETNKSMGESSGVFVENLNASLKTTFGLFDDNLSVITNHLAGVMDKIREQTNDLPDVIDQLSYNIKSFDDSLLKLMDKNEEVM